MGDIAERARAAVELWKEYGRDSFGVVPTFSSSTAAELFGSVVIFSTIHPGTHAAADSELLSELAGHI